MKEPKKAVFSFEDYRIKKFSFTAPLSNLSDDISIGFLPSGKFYKEEKKFVIDLNFQGSIMPAVKGDSEFTIVYAEMESTFIFDEVLAIDEIPDYFYRNSLAIIFPYLRAFISTLTFQANQKPPMLLPILNLTELEKTFKESVKVIEDSE